MPIILRLFNLSCKSLNGKLLNTQQTFQRLPSTRTVSLIPLKRFMKEEKFAQKDKAPEGFKIIYRAPMEYYIKTAKIISTGSAAFMSGLAALKFATDTKYLQLSTELTYGPLVAHDSDIFPLAAGFIAINATIMIFITKYPLRIYKKDKSYLAIFEGLLPFGIKRLSYNQGQVKEFKHFLNPWSLITFKIKDTITLLMLDYFKTPSEFHEMCEEPKSENK
ncbi:uncharacterized protein LOC129905116 [Episyrphus balteatus]|uniref:uncharacterized protein LOC129905116 n=1 Tax=Episyrphus balteatus TaxID=286459 RepID=UPI002485324A|nr:uncharacterized protein LOC129905116 [Episyrphus balteatus]